MGVSTNISARGVGNVAVLMVQLQQVPEAGSTYLCIASPSASRILSTENQKSLDCVKCT